ncbi:MAG: SRPBCC family protein [Saprospiraceae bacterium]|nr:SRPBCC family protein [Saprospiraceae bacterium]
MKVIKIIGIVILVLIALPLIVAIFVPKSYTVSVSETINVPKQQVYDYVRILDNQKEYSVWVLEDPKLRPVITGTDGTVGATQSWNSQVDGIGEGEQEIIALTPDRMDIELRFKRPMEGTAKAANIFTELNPNQTKLTTEFYSNDKYPLNLMSYFMGRKYITEASTQNLQNIKKNLERLSAN